MLKKILRGLAAFIIVTVAGFVALVAVVINTYSTEGYIQFDDYEYIQYYASTGPLWQNDRYRNVNQSNYFNRNFALANEIMRFFDIEAATITTGPLPPGHFNLAGPNVDEMRLSDDFSAIYARGFRNDSFFDIFPFNHLYLQRVLSSNTFRFPQDTSWGFYDYFARQIVIGFHHDDGPDSRSRDWNNAGNRRVFAELALHEVSHALGLFESLTSLVEVLYFDEIWLNYEGAALGHWDIMDSWYRSPYFDMVLLERAGHEVFWTAAFTSNTAYGELWNTHLGDFVPFYDLQIIRQFITTHVHDRLFMPIEDFGAYTRFRRFRGFDGNEITAQSLYEIPQMFYYVFNYDIPEERRETYAAHVQYVFAQILEFIEIDGLHVWPMPAVMDWVIASH